MSNTASESDAFVQLVAADPLRHAAVQAVTGAEGGATAEKIADPGDPYWGRVLQRITQAGLTPEQVQVVWYKDANAYPTTPFPQHARALQADHTAVMQNLATIFPNAVLCFVSSRIYAGYATTTLNPEPYAFETGFACKWMIERQIAGAPELNFDAQRGPVSAPWIAWGPYLWADGLQPRADGLVWKCSDFLADGTHPSPSGASKVANLLLRFLREDAVTSPWYLASATASQEGTAPAAWTALPASPNPFTSRVVVGVDALVPERIHATVYSIDGRAVRTLPELGPGRTHGVVWDGRNNEGVPVAPGTYLVVLQGETATQAIKATLRR
jgi:hypothetical protein